MDVEERRGRGSPVAISGMAGGQLAAAGVDGQEVLAAQGASKTRSGEGDAGRGARGLACPRNRHPASAPLHDAVPADASPEPCLREGEPPCTAAFHKTFKKLSERLEPSQPPRISQQHSSSTAPNAVAGPTLTNSGFKAPPPAPHRTLRCDFSLRSAPEFPLPRRGQARPRPRPWAAPARGAPWRRGGAAPPLTSATGRAGHP